MSTPKSTFQKVGTFCTPAAKAPCCPPLRWLHSLVLGAPEQPLDCRFLRISLSLALALALARSLSLSLSLALPPSTFPACPSHRRPRADQIFDTTLCPILMHAPAPIILLPLCRRHRYSASAWPLLPLQLRRPTATHCGCRRCPHWPTPPRMPQVRRFCTPVLETRVRQGAGTAMLRRCLPRLAAAEDAHAHRVRAACAAPPA